MTKYWLKKIGLLIAALIFLYIVFFLALSIGGKNAQEPGVTFSRPYAEQFKMDPDEVLTATLDDLGVRRFRIPAYWSLLQPTEGQWDWAWLDRDLDNIAQRNGTVVLAIGEKLPRWPECWIPDWALKLPQADREAALKEYLRQVVSRYQNHPAVKGWQLENEIEFPFGTCPERRESLYDEEVQLVRELDQTKPIATTDSGELSFWSLGGKVDRLGVSVYRVVVSPLGIFTYWFIPPQFYLRKSQVMGWIWNFRNTYISEFQMEPWTKRATLLETPIDEQMETFDIKQMSDNISFAQKSGFSTIDYWGVEWWYWMMKTQDKPEFWEMARLIFGTKAYAQNK